MCTFPFFLVEYTSFKRIIYGLIFFLHIYSNLIFFNDMDASPSGRSQGKLDVKTPSPTPRSRPTFRAAVFCASSQLSFPGTSCMHLLINTLALKLHLKYRESLMEEYD
ncbi:hypothetical protein I3760_09G196000 [Carya illinoinensis]|nr:hypothetical protein I3760_09G196000 [Carya illinoinensis]